jgi:hypothetical protein
MSDAMMGTQEQAKLRRKETEQSKKTPEAKNILVAGQKTPEVKKYQDDQQNSIDRLQAEYTKRKKKKKIWEHASRMTPSSRLSPPQVKKQEKR